jgi:putative transposase
VSHVTDNDGILSGLVDLNGVSPEIVRWADARAELCVHFRSYSAAWPVSQGAALKEFERKYNSGEIEVSAETRELVPAITSISLYRWVKKWREGGVAALVPGWKGSKSIIEPAMRDHILAQISYQPHVRATRVHEGLTVRFAEAPALRTVQDFIGKWKRENPALYMRLRDPDNFKRKFSIALGNAAAKVTRVNQLWEIDGSPADAYCTDGLFHLNTVIDVFSRRMVALLTPAASGEATAQLLRKALPVMGIPDEIKSDWGREYLNGRIQRAAARIGTTWRKVARPYAGELKPFVERNQGTTLHNFFEQVPGFKGHSTRQMSEIRAQRSFQQRRGERRNLQRIYDIQLSSTELQELLDRWLDAVYGERPHAGLLGKTPNGVFRTADAAGQVRRVADERLLDMMFGEDGVAVVSSKGVRVSNVKYWSDALVAWRGRKIQYVRTRDAGELLIYSEDGREFVAIAQNYEGAAGLDRQVVALAAKTREKEWMRGQLADLRRKRRQHKPERILRQVIGSAEARSAAALAPDADKIASLPYRSPALDSSARALAAVLDSATNRPAPPIEHADRREELDAAWERISANDSRIPYDEGADTAQAVARYLTLRETPRADWSAEDCDFMQLCAELPEIKSLGRRALARPSGDLDQLDNVLAFADHAARRHV